MNHFVRHDNIKCLGHHTRGVHPPTEKMQDVFFFLRKFATSGCYTQQRLGKKNVSTQKVDKVDKEFKCEKNNPIAQKTKN